MISGLDLPIALKTSTSILMLRRARVDDLPALMKLLADDPVSASRGDRSDPADMPAYERALAELIADSSNEILMVVSDTDDPVATMQLTKIPRMARRGSTRLLVEAVRVASEHRSGGVGSAMMR
ncbi:GNAT family N-acetyltransferase [Lacisediminihabitans changchengi]|uniref:GNAT family N-acetyltransferase n=1 Tax=Lacisediminihabitans changchengi TaxID=2787634 RepID=UPI0027DD50FF|nr:GNAT family N-acetyltransferase [Lacisediminihabitans changchengi]